MNEVSFIQSLRALISDCLSFGENGLELAVSGSRVSTLQVLTAGYYHIEYKFIVLCSKCECVSVNAWVCLDTQVMHVACVVCTFDTLPMISDMYVY